MELSAIIAIIRGDRLEHVELSLQELGVRGLSVSKGKGYGEYPNFFARDWMVENVRLEIFTTRDKVDAIAATIMRAAHTGARGDGIVVVYPIEKFFNVRLGAPAMPDAV